MKCRLNVYIVNCKITKVSIMTLATVKQAASSSDKKEAMKGFVLYRVTEKQVRARYLRSRDGFLQLFRVLSGNKTTPIGSLFLPLYKIDKFTDEIQLKSIPEIGLDLPRETFRIANNGMLNRRYDDFKMNQMIYEELVETLIGLSVRERTFSMRLWGLNCEYEHSFAKGTTRHCMVNAGKPIDIYVDVRVTVDGIFIYRRTPCFMCIEGLLWSDGIFVIPYPPVRGKAEKDIVTVPPNAILICTRAMPEQAKEGERKTDCVIMVAESGSALRRIVKDMDITRRLVAKQNEKPMKADADAVESFSESE